MAIQVRIGTLAALLWLGCGLGLANASTVSFEYSGTLSSTVIAEATAVTGTMTYDTTSYTAPLLDGSVSVGGLTFSYAAKPSIIANLNSLYVYNDVGSPAFDSVVFYTGLTGPDVTYNGAVWQPSYLILSFGNDPTVLSSSAIPDDPTILNQFSIRSANLQFQELDANGTPLGVYSGLASSTTLSISPVPIPDAGSLLLSGLVLALVSKLALRVQDRAGTPKPACAA